MGLDQAASFPPSAPFHLGVTGPTGQPPGVLRSPQPDKNHPSPSSIIARLPGRGRATSGALASTDEIVGYQGGLGRLCDRVRPERIRAVHAATQNARTGRSACLPPLGGRSSQPRRVGDPSAHRPGDRITLRDRPSSGLSTQVSAVLAHRVADRVADFDMQSWVICSRLIAWFRGGGPTGTVSRNTIGALLRLGTTRQP